MPSDTKTYQEETYIDNTIRLRGVLNTMPDFARDYFRAIEPTTSPKTRISYAYDIRLFFQFLIEENPVYKHHSIKDFQVQDLEAIQPVDIEEYLEYLNDEVDIYDTSAGLNASIQYQIDANYLEDGWRSYMAKAVRDKFGKPTIAIGNIRDPKIANDILARGDADLIGMGRGLIADPDWCNKAQYGDVCDIRKCISCNVGCVGNRIGGNKPLRCTVNPDLINGEAYKKQKVNKPCNVVVVGAGTAGLEAACTAAEVGCNVTLLEKGKEVGGLSVEISKIPEETC